MRLFSQVKEAVQLDILVENMGRVNYGLDMDRQRKGGKTFLKQPDLIRGKGRVVNGNRDISGLPAFLPAFVLVK